MRWYVLTLKLSVIGGMFVVVLSKSMRALGFLIHILSFRDNDSPILLTMSPPFKNIAAILTVTFALALRPMIVPFLLTLNLAPADDSIGTIPVLTPTELSNAYAGKKALFIGGTRGIGYGTALAMATAGADVTLVGRSEKSGAVAVERIRAAVTNDKQRVDFIQGDIGSLQSVNQLVETLASRPVRYDYLVVTAMTFPDWSAPTTSNEDGFDQSYFIGVIGRFIIYRNMYRFLREGQDAYVLNVLAAGEKPTRHLDRDLASGKREPKNLLDDLSNTALANDLTLIGLQENDPNISGKITFVSTHPGMLKTDLHRGQGRLFDLMEALLVSLAGISEEECGMRQASILASNKLHNGSLSYVDLFMYGRTRSPQLQAQVDKNLDWMWSLLTELEGKSKPTEDNFATSY